MKKRFISFVLAASLLLSGFSLNGQVSDFRRTAEGYMSIVVRALRSTFGIKSYTDFDEICNIPGVEHGYVPQGYCYSESEKLHFISCYHDKKASIIAVVNSSECTYKILNLKNGDGSDFTGHAGGIAEDGKYFYLTEGNKIHRVLLSDLINTDNDGSVTLGQTVTTDVKCSYLNSDGEYLYAGEFYTFTTDGSYDTDKSHHMAISLFETTYARCNAYRISDISDYFDSASADKPVPEIIFTTPDCVQGFARMPDGTFALSISYGRDNNSSLRLYEDVTKAEADFSVDYGEKSVPAYHLKKSTEISDTRLPPLLEGVDDMDSKPAGIFESCADKYSDAAVIVDKICVF